MQFYFKLILLSLVLIIPNISFAKEPLKRTILSLESMNSGIANEKQIVFKVTEYLKTLRKVSFDIKQIDQENRVFLGKLLISKPHDFRWNYYAPYPLLIVGNKSFVTIYDHEMQQMTNIKPEENIFQFLMSDTGINENFDVIDASFKNQQYTLVIKHKEFEKRAHIVLYHNPTKLRSITIIDPDSSWVRVEFSNCQNVSSFDDDLFAIKNPEVFGEPYRYDKEEIEAKIKF